MGFACSKDAETSPALCDVDTGGAIIACQAELRSAERKGDIDVFAQRIDDTGRMLWLEGKRSVAVASSPWHEIEPIAAPDGQGGAVVVFTQRAAAGEYAGDFDTAAMHVGPSGVTDWERKNRAVDVSDTAKLERHPRLLVIGGWRWL